MATLTARGNRILARVTLKRETPESDLTTEEVREFALRSDGAILSRRAVRFKPDLYTPKGRWHDHGWKVAKRGVTTSPDEWIEPFRRKGWETMLSG